VWSKSRAGFITQHASRISSAQYLEFSLPDPAALDENWNVTDRAEALYRRGHAAWAHGLFQEALSSFARARRCDHTHVPAIVGQSEILVVLGDFEGATRVVNEGLERFGRSAELGAARGHCYLHVGDLDRALQCCDMARELAPDNVYAWLIGGEVRLGLRDALWSAQEAFHTARECVFLWPYMDLRIALAYLEWGCVRECAMTLRSVLRIHNRLPYLWMLLGDACRLMGQRRRAGLCYRKAMRLEPRLAHLRAHLGLRGVVSRTRARLASILRAWVQGTD
jgi:tetratricopeptide (TPR) repeat protein